MDDQNSKTDPFKPLQPQIPGVPQRNAKNGATISVFRPPPWVLAAGGGALLVIIFLVWWFSHPSRAAAPVSASEPAAIAPAPPPKPAVSAPLGPGEVATTDELSEAWSSKKFDFNNTTTKETLQAIVVRLPGDKYWAFTLREPFGDCQLEYVRDLKRLQNYYDIRSDHPLVGNPCNRSVYDLLKWGPGIDGLVRGEMVQGSGLRPPMAIEVKVEGHKIIAVRAE